MNAQKYIKYLYQLIRNQKKKVTVFVGNIKNIIFAARNGFLAEWIGRGLQNLLRQFESARNLND